MHMEGFDVQCGFYFKNESFFDNFFGNIEMTITFSIFIANKFSFHFPCFFHKTIQSCIMCKKLGQLSINIWLWYAKVHWP